MVVEESRVLQVSIFNILQNNLRTVDFSKMLLDVITIADEVDSQLKRAMLCYVESGSRPVGGVGHLDLISCGLSSAGLPVRRSYRTTPCCSSLAA